jgi:hypothetical protein
MTYKDENAVSYGLDKFISLVKNKTLAHSNKYSAVFYLPKTLQSSSENSDATSNANLQRLTLLCDSVSIPGLSLITNDVAVYGEARQMPTQRLFSDMNMTFYVDHEMNAKRFFDSWMDTIINPNTRSAYYYNDYIANADIYVHDINTNVTYKVTLKECYPKAIQQIDMSYASRELMKMQVTLQYKYYNVENIEMDTEDFLNFISSNNVAYSNSLNPAFDFTNNPT